MRKFIVLLLLPFCFAGCKKSQAEIDDGIIQQYIKANHLSAISEPDGLYYVPLQAGSGGSPTINSTVVINYTGYFTDSLIFDQSPLPATFILDEQILGWQEGIPLLQKGGSGILLVPSALGFGAQGAATVPGNTVLIYNMQLLNFH
jgi:FKBP-type peptidyl-prolyl cis-trans isomerase FkpA